jgi:hypothetical protein
MHRTDGANNVGGMFKDSPTPGTTVEHFWLTATQEEIVQAILKSRQTLYTSGALDAAASPPYQQLLKAIHRLGHAYFDFTSIVTDGTGLDTGFVPDALAYRLDPDPGGDTPGRHVLLPSNINSILGSVANTHGYTILIVNNTPSMKYLEDSVNHVFYPLMPGQGTLMYGWNDTGNRIVWCQFGAESTNDVTSTHLYGVTSAANVGSHMVDSTFTYLVGKHVSITVHQIEVLGLPGSGESRFSCTPGPDVDLPVGVSGYGVQRLIQIGIGGGTYTFEVGVATLYDGGVMTIARLNGDGFAAGSNILIRPFEISCSL